MDTNTNKAKYLKYKMECLTNIFQYIDSRISDLKVEYGKTGEERQSYHYENREKILEYNDDGTPKMEDVWGEIPKTELSEEDTAKIKAYEELSEALSKVCFK